MYHLPFDLPSSPSSWVASSSLAGCHCY